MHVNNVLKDILTVNDNKNTDEDKGTLELGPVPVDAHPPTVAIRLDRVRGQYAGNSVAVEGEDMSLGFPLLHNGDDVLTGVCSRRLSVHGGRREAPANHRLGDFRSSSLLSRLVSNGSRWGSWLYCRTWGWSW